MTLLGCAQLMKGQQQPVKLVGDGTYFTTCSGTVEDWASCNTKARNTCKGVYETVKRNESLVGATRELTFKCK